MILNRLFVLGTLFYFSFVGTFSPNSEEHLSEYLDDVRNEENYYNIRSKKQDICTVPTDMYAAICHKILLMLREYPEYESILYLNYNAIISITKENKCKEVFVKINPLPVSDNTQEINVKQQGLICYARESVDGEYAQAPEKYPFYEKIVIYPSDYKSLRIFEQVSDDNTYNFKMKMEPFMWRQIKPIHESKISDLSVPGSSALTNEYLQDLIQSKPEKRKRQDDKRILSYVTHYFLQQLCTMAYGRLKYSNHFRINKALFDKNLPSKRTVILSSSENSQVFKANICFGYKIDLEGNKQLTQEYLIMQGINWDEIILLKKSEDTAQTTPAEPLELIKNVQKSYLQLVFYGYRFL